jgi:hypothetical protein
MFETRAAEKALRAYISHSREDIAFAQRIDAARISHHLLYSRRERKLEASWKN